MARCTCRVRALPSFSATRFGCARYLIQSIRRAPRRGHSSWRVLQPSIPRHAGRCLAISRRPRIGCEAIMVLRTAVALGCLRLDPLALRRSMQPREPQDKEAHGRDWWAADLVAHHDDLFRFWIDRFHHLSRLQKRVRPAIRIRRAGSGSPSIRPGPALSLEAVARMAGPFGTGGASGYVRASPHLNPRQTMALAAIPLTLGVDSDSGGSHVQIRPYKPVDILANPWLFTARPSFLPVKFSRKANADFR